MEHLTKDTFIAKVFNYEQNKDWKFDDFLGESVVIDEVRYTTLEFLLAVKQSWLLEKDARQKDIDDAELIKNYLLNKNNT